jgi:hypothetical protein
MKELLGDFEARTRCGLINLGSLVDTLVMLNLQVRVVRVRILVRVRACC